MAELGDEAETWHTQVGYAARSAGVELLFGVGALARFATNSFGQGASLFSYTQALFIVLQKIPSSTFKKASRLFKTPDLIFLKIPTFSTEFIPNRS
jgi:UDP-N-acetylmuramyl pentapeptide synthase